MCELLSTVSNVRVRVVLYPMLLAKLPARGTFPIEECRQALCSCTVKNERLNTMPLACLKQTWVENQRARKGKHCASSSCFSAALPDDGCEPIYLARLQEGLPLGAQAFQVNAVPIRPSVDLKVQHLKVLGEPAAQCALP